jgi:sigma-B regulation protein RsbU (phosphoserine phosphatase)
VLRKLSIGRRLALLFVLGAGLVLAVVSYFTFMQARDLLLAQQRSIITQALQATAGRIETVEGAVEKVVQGTALLVEDLELKPDQAAEILQRTVLRNDELVGSAVAYDPDTYGHVAPYAYMDGDVVEIKDLGRDGRAYEVGDWFQLPYQMHEPQWTEPYYDEGGADMLTATYAVPVRIGDDPEPVSAVVTGDVSLTWLSHLLQSLDLGDTGYAFLVSQNGTFIAHPDAAFIMNESIFSVAEARDDPRLRRIGRDMTSGETGYVVFDGIERLEPSGRSYLAYAPIPSTGWALGIVYAESEVNGAVIELNRLSWAIDLVGLAALLAIALLVARTITRPLNALDLAAQTLAQGDLDAPLPQARGRDEVARLTTSFGRMRDDLRERIEELRVTTAARERIESELRIAAGIQMSLVPRTFPPYPQRHDLELFALLEPAREVGGDFYDFFLMDDDHLALAIAVVSGKGMPAALMMAVGRSFLRSYSRLGGGPSQILASLNDELSTDNDTSMFVTLFLAVVDLRTGETRYASAGHNRPFVVRHDGAVEQLPRTRGIALGARAGMAFAEAELTLAHGDALFLYTDGVSEAMNAADEVFTEERIATELAQAARGSCRDILDALNAGLRAHAAGVEQSDDITMVAFRYLGGGGPA